MTTGELELCWPLPALPALPVVAARTEPRTSADEVPEFAAYPIGGNQAVVCTSLGAEQATALLNVEYPGDVAWRVSPARSFPRGTPNPGPCETAPATHRHLLFEH
jgi:hypothetical protein